MPVLHLGVEDKPYAHAGGTTVHEVAKILEDKYHIMEVFFEDLGSENIAHALEKSAADAIENIMLGALPESISLTAAATQEIGDAFRHFLSLQLMDGVVAGVPTRAALRGVNHRLAHPYAKTNSARPSFIDTGTYESSFRAWID